MYIYTFISGVF